MNEEILLEKLMNELEIFRADLDFEVKDLSKKELQRSVKSLRSLIIATLEHPLAETQEITSAMNPMLERALGIRHLHTAFSMYAIGDDVKKEVKKVAKKATKKNKKENENG